MWEGIEVTTEPFTDRVGGVAQMSRTDDSALVVVRNLTKRFGDRTAVDGISFQINRSEVFGLLGPNGAGKSTTVNMLSTYLPPDSGVITIGGRPTSGGMDVKRLVGFVPQDRWPEGVAAE